MNEESRQPHIDPGLEARLVAFVLGEASDFEREELNRLIEQRPELAVFREDIQRIHGLLRDVSSGEMAASDEAWKLPSEKRDKLLGVFRGDVEVTAAAKRVDSSVVTTPRRPVWRKRIFWAVTSAAATLLAAVFLGGALLQQRSADVAQASARRRLSGEQAQLMDESDSSFERFLFSNDIQQRTQGAVTARNSKLVDPNRQSQSALRGIRDANDANLVTELSDENVRQWGYSGQAPETQLHSVKPELPPATADPSTTANDSLRLIPNQSPTASAETEFYSPPLGATAPDVDFDGSGRLNGVVERGRESQFGRNDLVRKLAEGTAPRSESAERSRSGMRGMGGFGGVETSGMANDGEAAADAGEGYGGYGGASGGYGGFGGGGEGYGGGGGGYGGYGGDYGAGGGAGGYGSGHAAPNDSPVELGLPRGQSDDDVEQSAEKIINGPGTIDRLAMPELKPGTDRYDVIESEVERLHAGSMMSDKAEFASPELAEQMPTVPESLDGPVLGHIAGRETPAGKSLDLKSDGVWFRANQGQVAGEPLAELEGGSADQTLFEVDRPPRQSAGRSIAERDPPRRAGNVASPSSSTFLPALTNRAKKSFLSRRTPAGLPEKNAKEEAFSTFSLHVSDVSFKLARAALFQGQWPEASKIRVEEFVNAFDYGDPLPSTEEKITCAVEQSIHPFLQQRNLLRVSLRTAAAGRSSGTPLRLTFLLDNSGSMERPDRRKTVRRAFALLAEQLTSIDQVTLISFARRPRLMADKVSGTKADELVQRIENLPSEGGTNIEAALQLGFEKAREQQLDGAQNRVVLLTDGAVNLGNADPTSLSRLVTTMRDSGIAFDAAGIAAEGLNDEVLEALTRNGDGRYYLLDSVEAADDGFARQIAGALRPSAGNVKVQVEFNPHRVGRYQLLGFEKHRLKKEDFRDDQVDAAEMAAAEAGVAMYQFEPKPDGVGDVGSVSVRFRDAATGRMVENRWPIPYQPDAPRPDQSSPSLRIATSAALLAVKLRGDPLGESVELQALAELVAGLPPRKRSVDRVQQLEQMIQQARQISGH